jgi:hypothetical protein
MEYFNKNHIEVLNRDPVPHELNLFYSRDKGFSLLHIQTTANAFIEKLIGKTLGDLQIIHIYPWYNAVFPVGENKIASKRVLLKVSNKQVYYVPWNDLDLTGFQIINKQTSTFRKPLESLKTWCKRYGYTLNRRQFTDQELLQELHGDICTSCSQKLQ